MTKTSNSAARTLSITAAILFTTFLAPRALEAAPPEKCGDNKCNGGETAETCPADCAGAGQGGGGGVLSTCDTFRDGEPDSITSDGGRYCNSEKRVSAVIGSKNGGHHLDTEKSGRALSLDFGDGMLVVTEAVLSIENGSRPGGVNLLEMTEGEAKLVGLVIGFKTGRRDHARLSFGRLSTVVACANAGDKVTVTRGIGQAKDSWTFESLAGDQACLSEVLNNDFDNPVAVGFFQMPFLVTVEIQP